MIGLTLSKNYKDIADAIRSQGGSGTYKPAEMADAIRGLGGGIVLWNYPIELSESYTGDTENNSTSKGGLSNYNAVYSAALKNKDISIKFNQRYPQYGNFVTIAGTGSLYVYNEASGASSRVKFQYGSTSLAWVNYAIGDDVELIITHDKHLKIIVNGNLLFDELAPSAADNLWTQAVGHTDFKFGKQTFTYVTMSLI